MVNEQLPWLKPSIQQDQPGLAWRDQIDADFSQLTLQLPLTGEDNAFSPMTAVLVVSPQFRGERLPLFPIGTRPLEPLEGISLGRMGRSGNTNSTFLVFCSRYRVN